MSIKLFFTGAEAADAKLRQMMERLRQLDRDAEPGAWTPPVDIYEDEQAVYLVAELAGVDRKGIKVILDGQVVRLYGQRPPVCPAAGAQYHRMEIVSGHFGRSFHIGVAFDPSRVEAKSNDGLLVVTLPKSGPPQARRVDVRTI